MHLSKAAVFIAEWQKTVSSIVCVVLLGTKFDPPRDMVVPGLFILGTATSIYFAFKLYCNERWENAIWYLWRVKVFSWINSIYFKVLLCVNMFIKTIVYRNKWRFNYDVALYMNILISKVKVNHTHNTQQKVKVKQH